MRNRMPVKRSLLGVTLALLAVGVIAGRAGAKRAERGAAEKIELGVNKSLHGRPVFPPSDPWNQDISKEAVDPNSERLIASIGLTKPLHPDFGKERNGYGGIPYV